MDKNIKLPPPINIHLGRILDNEIKNSLSQTEVDDLIKLLILYNRPDDIEEYLFNLKMSVSSLFDKLLTSIIHFKIQNDEFYDKMKKNENKQVSKDQTLTIGEVCSMMNISRPTLNNWFLKGLKKIKVGHLVFIYKSDLEQYLRDNSIEENKK